MAFFEWDDSYSVGVAQIDEQHRRLIDLINRLYEMQRRTEGDHTVAAVLDELTTLATVIEELIDYTLYHFSTEEALMRRHAYPEYPSHREAHSDLANRVRTFQRDFDDGRALSSVDLAQFLQEWLKQHIVGTDMRLGRFLNGKALTEEGAT